jgi:phosphoglucosamine mutase
MSRLFGTDGIRGEAGREPLDQLTLYRVGRALARNLHDPGSRRVLIGRDTRSSGTTIESWLRAGIQDGGGQGVSAGVITTPAVAVLTRRSDFSAGVVISASHNPYPDNGVKIFSGDGSKSGAALESAIEKEVAEASDDSTAGLELPTSAVDHDIQEEYLRFLESTLPPSLELPPFRIVLDCANGAAYQIGPSLLSRLGLQVEAMGTSPDGRNINKDCGSTHPEEMARRVVESASDLGASLDGDGDRLLLADNEGRIVDGDAILLMCGRRWKRDGQLTHSGIVATVMSNLALEKTLEEEGIRLFRTQVGDKYVAEEMARRDLPIGGEQSGHIIFSEHSPTGDGLLTLVQVLRVMAVEAKSLAELATLKPFPQILLNIRVHSKPDISEVPEILRAVEDVERQMKGRGRVLVRYSGTEPLLRIMMEGPDEREIRSLSNTIGDAARRTLGDI